MRLRLGQRDLIVEQCLTLCWSRWVIDTVLSWWYLTSMLGLSVTIKDFHTFRTSISSTNTTRGFCGWQIHNISTPSEPRSQVGNLWLGCKLSTSPAARSGRLMDLRLFVSTNSARVVHNYSSLTIDLLLVDLFPPVKFSNVLCVKRETHKSYSNSSLTTVKSESQSLNNYHDSHSVRTPQPASQSKRSRPVTDHTSKNSIFQIWFDQHLGATDQLQCKLKMSVLPKQSFARLTFLSQLPLGQITTCSFWCHFTGWQNHVLCNANPKYVFQTHQRPAVSWWSLGIRPLAVLQNWQSEHSISIRQDSLIVRSPSGRAQQNLTWCISLDQQFCSNKLTYHNVMFCVYNYVISKSLMTSTTMDHCLQKP